MSRHSQISPRSALLYLKEIRKRAVYFEGVDFKYWKKSCWNFSSRAIRSRYTLQINPFEGMINNPWTVNRIALTHYWAEIELEGAEWPLWRYRKNRCRKKSLFVHTHAYSNASSQRRDVTTRRHSCATVLSLRVKVYSVYEPIQSLSSISSFFTKF